MGRTDHLPWAHLLGLLAHLYRRAKPHLSALDEDARFELELYDDELAGALSYLKKGKLPERREQVVAGLADFRTRLGGAHRHASPEVAELLALYELLGTVIAGTLPTSTTTS